MLEWIILFCTVVIQNASFTLVSRARNSSSLIYHGGAAILSNGIWLLVIRQVILNINEFHLMMAYLCGSVLGSVSMHYVAMRFFETGKKTRIDYSEQIAALNLQISDLTETLKKSGINV